MLNGKTTAAATLAVLLAGCASAPQPQPPAIRQHAPATQAEPFKSASQEVIYRVFLGELALQRGDQQQAARQYARAAQLSEDSSLIRHALMLAYRTGNDRQAWQLDQRWLKLSPGDRAARQFQAILAARLGRAAEAARYFGALTQGARPMSYVSIASLLGQEATAPQGLPVMQRLVDAAPKSADAHYAYAELALHYRHAPLAESQARRALQLKPKLEGAQVLLARALAAQGKFDAALAIIRSRVQAAHNDVALQLAFAALLAQAGKDTEATHEFRRILKRHPLNTQALYSLGLLELSANHFGAAHKYFMRLYNTGQELSTAAYFLGNTAEMQHQYPAALDWYRQVTDGTRWLPAQYAIIRVLLASDLPDAARQFTDALAADHPEAAGQIRAAAAQMFADHGDKQSAHDILDAALAKTPNDEDLLYERALLEESEGKVAAAERDLRQILKQSPANVDALNALGYTLVIYSTRYREALGFIQQALTLRPGDPAIMDSMGWVQYRLGHAEVALKYLREAYSLQNDPQIAAHLVEVLLANGKRDEAHALWLTASKQHPESQELKKLGPRVAP